MLVVVVCLLVGSEIVTVIIGVMVFVVTVTAFDWLITAVVRSLVGEVVVVFTVTVVSGAADLIRGDEDIVEVGTVEIIKNKAVKAVFFSKKSNFCLLQHTKLLNSQNTSAPVGICTGSAVGVCTGFRP